MEANEVDRMKRQLKAAREGLQEIVSRPGVHCQGECEVSHAMVEIARATLKKMEV